MLDQMCDGVDTVATLETQNADVDLPDGWRADTDRPKPQATCLDDLRHYTRYQYRTRARLSVAPSLPSIPRSSAALVVFTKDVSREGIAFYVGEQFYPRERLQLWLPGQGMQAIRITRCRKLKPRCYEIGARFE